MARAKETHSTNKAPQNLKNAMEHCHVWYKEVFIRGNKPDGYKWNFKKIWCLNNFDTSMLLVK